MITSPYNDQVKLILAELFTPRPVQPSDKTVLWTRHLAYFGLVGRSSVTTRWSSEVIKSELGRKETSLRVESEDCVVMIALLAVARPCLVISTCLGKKSVR
jgi:hypothetical protein